MLSDLIGKFITYKRVSVFKMYIMESEDGAGIGWGDHFLPHKFIERSFER